ncbi:MAG: hypothetical protein DMG05_30885 [Acidobacteria bacterium]|nr:MAG: hypothetical protein DMG05_30885 [Acidobacteriota bacterium]
MAERRGRRAVKFSSDPDGFRYPEHVMADDLKTILPGSVVRWLRKALWILIAIGGGVLVLLLLLLLMKYFWGGIPVPP